MFLFKLRTELSGLTINLNDITIAMIQEKLPAIFHSGPKIKVKSSSLKVTGDKQW